MTKPEFLLIPMIVYDRPELGPTDKVVYAIIYWYEHMREGICKASNGSIAAIARVDDRTVRAALDRLEQVGFIKRFYKDKDRKIRIKIKCLAWYQHEPEPPMPGEEQAALTGIPDPRPETPKQFAQRFFSGDETVVEQLIDEVIAASGGKIPKEALTKEMRKFIAWWSEPNGSGTKQAWQMKPTFEVKRRLYTWLSRAAERNKSLGVRPRAGAGVTL